MLENPYLAPPQVESPQSDSWAQGFIYGFEGPAQSSVAQGDVDTGDADAFNEGVLAGQDAALNGLELDGSCIDLNEEPPSIGHFAADFTAEGIFTAVTLLAKHFAALSLEGIVAVVNLSIALETFSDDPDVALEQGVARLQQQMTAVGFSASLELFLGGGVDHTVAGCELKMTSLFRNQADAIAATQALGRAQWLVVRWRSDQSGGIDIVQSVGF